MDWRKVNIGDKIVRVRKHYQNYDHTRVPCEPTVYTVKWQNGSEMSMEEDTNYPFYHSDDNVVYGGTASAWSNIQIQTDFVTYKEFIQGNYERFHIDAKYKDLDEFLEVKRVTDYKRAKDKYNSRLEMLKEQHPTAR